MILNYEEVKQKGIFKGSVEDNYNNAVYDIRIGKIITMKGNDVDEFSIPPQGMAIVISSEEITMPVNVVGYAHVRTSLSGKGIMAINIGIIDPGYSGNLASTLLNFGKEDFPIKVGERFLRTTFHSIQQVTVNKTAQNKSQDYKHYITNKKFEASKYMDEKFMSFDKEVSKSIRKSFENFLRYISLIALTITFISLCLAAATFSFNFIFKKNPDNNEKIKQINYELLELKYRLLQAKTDSIILSQHKKNLPNKAKEQSASILKDGAVNQSHERN